jgi:hypothetical protein
MPHQEFHPGAVFSWTKINRQGNFLPAACRAQADERPDSMNDQLNTSGDLFRRQWKSRNQPETVGKGRKTPKYVRIRREKPEYAG